jgi:hypothetical protein
MPLPDDFSPWEHLQTVVMQTYNRKVREEFSDLGAEDWDPDIATSRGSLRVACTVLDDDSAVMVQIRMQLFYFILRKAGDLQTPIYGIPVPSFQEARKFRPQIQLYFQEDEQDIEEGYAPVTGEISFRLMNQTPETLSEGEIHTYANKVKAAFGTAHGFIWKKGRTLCAYTDRNRGYQLQLLCYNESEGRRVIEQVLDIQSHTPDWKYLNVSTNAEPLSRFPIIPPTEVIVGKSRRTPRQRPIADVRFRYAALHVHGAPNPWILIDLSGYHRHPVVDAA